MPKGFRSLFLLMTIIFVSVLLFACNSESTEDADSGDTDTPMDTPKEESKKVLIAGTDAAYAPMEYIDTNGDIVGIDIEVVDAIAEAAGFEVEYRNVGWDPLFPAVNNGEVDFAVSSITITEKRQQEFDFTDSYFEANQLVLAPEGSDIESFQDLKDLRVSAQINTTGHIVVKELLGETSTKIVAAETMPFAITEMLNGNADASVGDNAVIIDYQKSNPNVKLKVIEDDSFEKEYYGLMVKKGNDEITDLLNAGIQKIKEDGTLKEITGFDIE